MFSWIHVSAASARFARQNSPISGLVEEVEKEVRPSIASLSSCHAKARSASICEVCGYG